MDKEIHKGPGIGRYSFSGFRKVMEDNGYNPVKIGDATRGENWQVWKNNGTTVRYFSKTDLGSFPKVKVTAQGSEDGIADLERILGITAS